MATFNLTTVAGRDKLPTRREPYYVTLMQGCALGFRKMSSDRAGAWVARYTSSETRKSHKRALGAFDHLVPSDRFGAAKAAADAWFKHLGAGGGTQVVTVKVACETLSVSNFNKRVGVLTVGKDKAGNDRSLPLPKHPWSSSLKRPRRG